MDLNVFFDGVLALVSMVISAFLIPWLHSHLNEQQRKELQDWVDIAVRAAQQLYHDLNGAERKEFVMRFLVAQGYDPEDETVHQLVEAAVFRLHRQSEASVPPPASDVPA